jgi:nucleotide-binding universal stress UspA family protein
MSIENFQYRSALEDFRNARQRAALEDILARLSGRSNELLSYEEVARKLRLGTRADRGIRQIPVAAIVGSVGRYHDFTRSFLPRQSADERRWASVKAATLETGMPPIEVYKIGEAYFVLDGNHRVSIARQEKMETLDAHVIEIQTPVPLTPDIQPDDLIIKAEYAEFLEQTRADKLLPGVDLTLTAPGQYARLKEHIEVHRYFMGLDLQRDISPEEAVLDWYESVYQPIVEAIRTHGLLRWFPGRTETDLYLWVSEHRYELQERLGWEVSPAAAVADLAAQENPRAGDEQSRPGSWRLTKTVERYTEHLFADLLVPLSGSAGGWRALDQAIQVAQREGAALHGLHVARQKATAAAETIQARFEQACAAAGLRGTFLIEEGRVAARICERALLADLVVLAVDHPPEEGLAVLGSGLRAILRRCARPLLAIPEEVSSLDRALLAFDGSPQAREALFIAAYLAEVWKTTLTVAAVSGRKRLPADVLDYPRAYLELHEVQAEFLHLEGSIDILHTVMHERGLNLLVMGGYSTPILEELLTGSTVHAMLRQQHWPIFICR